MRKRLYTTIFKQMPALQKSDRKISHQNDLQVAVKEYTVNSLYPIVQLTADWR